MLSFICSNIQAIINTIGLLFDIAGAWLVAWEVVRKFEGDKVRISPAVIRLNTSARGFDDTDYVVGRQHAEETKEFKFWEAEKYIRMKWGLGFLTFGFLLQLASNWVVKFVSC